MRLRVCVDMRGVRLLCQKSYHLLTLSVPYHAEYFVFYHYVHAVPRFSNPSRRQDIALPYLFADRPVKLVCIFHAVSFH